MITIGEINTRPTMFISEGSWYDSVTKFHYNCKTRTLNITQVQQIPLPHLCTVLYHPVNGDITVYSNAHNHPDDIRRYLENSEMLYSVCDSPWCAEYERHTIVSHMLYLAHGLMGPNVYTTMHASYIVPEYFHANRHRLDDKVSAEEIEKFAAEYEARYSYNIPVVYGDIEAEIEKYAHVERNKIPAKPAKPKLSKSQQLAVDLAAEAVESGAVNPELPNWKIKVTNYVKSKMWLEHDYDYEAAIKWARFAYDYMNQG